MEPESVFLSYVRYTFKRWAGFQQAVIEGMGGAYAVEKELWMGNEIENYFKRYDKVYPDEIEDYLGEMIENEFNIVFEDNSLKEVSHNFCTAYTLSLTNPDDKIFHDMKNKPVIKQPSTTNSSQEFSEPTHAKQNEQAACEKLERLTISENKEDDGWTVVTKKNKNK